MTEQSEWTGRVGSIWAREAERTDRSFAPLTERLLDHPAMRAFDHALDVGCGAGKLSCRLAANPDKTVTGVDVSSELLAVARARCTGARFVEADAATWRPDAGAAPELIVSRHGVMFFADPVAAFRHLATIAAHGATLRFSCFRERTENDWALKLGEIAPGDHPPADPYAPGPFAFGNRERVEHILEQSGWRNTAFEALHYAMVGGEGSDAVEEAHSYFQRIGPAARALAALEGAQGEAALDKLRSLLAGELRERTGRASGGGVDRHRARARLTAQARTFALVAKGAIA